MRRKRQEDYQNVVDRLGGMQRENAKLKSVQVGKEPNQRSVS